MRDSPANKLGKHFLVDFTDLKGKTETFYVRNILDNIFNKEGKMKFSTKNKEILIADGSS